MTATARCAFTRFDLAKTGLPKTWKDTNPRQFWSSRSRVRASRCLWQLKAKLHCKNIGRPPGRLLCSCWNGCALEHRDAFDVNRVPFNVSGHGNVMSIVLLEGVGIVHRQDLLVLVGNDDWLGAGFDALLRARIPGRVSLLAATLGFDGPAGHGLRIGVK